MKKVLSGILALIIGGILSVSAFAAESAIEAVEVTVNGEEENLKDTLKDNVSDEDGMLRISADTLLKITLKLNGDDASKKDMGFITNKNLAENETLSKESVQFIDEKTTDDNGTVTIQFRPRLNQDIGIYNMRANAQGAAKFSKFYKTVADEKQPVISTLPLSDTPSGDDITATISDWTEAWQKANELFVIGEGNSKTKIEDYTIEGETDTKTLKIPATGVLAEPNKYTLKFIPIQAGSAYNPIELEVTVTEKVYSVTFDVDGVSINSFKASDITENGITLPANVSVNNGYEFKGWYKGDTQVKTITADNLASLYGTGKTLNLTAKIEPKTYNITYNLDNGKNADGNPDTYTIESNTITLLNPTRTGYTFAGWYSDENKTEKVTEIAKGSTGDKTLYAKWEEKMLAVEKSVVSSTQHDVVGGTENVIAGVNSTVQEDAEITFTVTPPVGYDVQSVKFNNTECENTEGGYKFTASGDAVKIEVTLDPIEYTINFDVNGGVGEYEPAKGTIEQPPQLPTDDPTKADHKFTGWVNEETKRPITPEILKNDFANKIPAFGESHSITAQATYVARGKYTVMYQALSVQDPTKVPGIQENIDWENNKTITISEIEPSKEGYTFAGWKVKVDENTDFESDTTYKTDGNNTYTVAEGVTKVTFVAQWTPIEYKINYELNGGKNNESNPTEYTADTETITLAEPTKAGYTFAGWYTEAEFINEAATIAKGSTGNRTFYAKWKAVTYTITLNNDETSSEISGTVENLPKLTTPVKDGYEFKGWFTAAEGGDKVDAITAENIASLDGATLYAHWEEIQTDTYKILSVDKVNSSVRVIKRTDDSAYLIAATYTKSGKLVKASIKKLTEQTGASGADISMPDAFSGEYTNVKVFMWDTLENMQPRCDALEK